MKEKEKKIHVYFRSVNNDFTYRLMKKLKEIKISHTFFTRLTLLYSAMGDTHQLSNNEMD